MAGPATILREIHRLHRHAKELQAEIERGPRLLKAQREKISRQELLGVEGHDAVKKLKLKYLEKESLLKATHQQISKHEKQLNEVTSKKEYDALKAEIASDQKKCRAIEDEMLEVLGEVEAKTAQLPDLEKAIQKAKQDYLDFEKSYQGRVANLQEQLKEARQQLAQAEVGLPSEVRPNYDRMVASKGEDALAVVQNRTCMACNTAITAQNLNELIQSQFVACKSCGRVLYLVE